MDIANGSSISKVQSPQNAGATAGSPLDKLPGKDAFLKLLVAQLRNQNPLNPLQGTDFIAQTAQFTSLEQLQQINASLAAMATSSSASHTNTSLDAVLASNYLGRTVVANGTLFEQAGTGAAMLRYSVPSDAASVQIDIQDLQGNTVRTIPLEKQAAGAYQVVFDGIGDNGRPIPGGHYRYRVTATDAGGREIDGTSTVSGLVTGLNFEGAEPLLMINGSLVPLSSISQVSLTS